MSVGFAVENNLDALLNVPLAAGTRLVVGDGPALERPRAKHPDVRIVGTKRGTEPARHDVCGDVFVFPSRTDTFGLVLLETLASGVPVAASSAISNPSRWHVRAEGSREAGLGEGSTQKFFAAVTQLTSIARRSCDRVGCNKCVKGGRPSR